MVRTEPLTHAVLVGVAAPPPFMWAQGQTFTFPALNGVGHDLDSYERILRSSSGGEGIVIDRRESEADTTRDEIISVVEFHSKSCTCELLVLALVGHGFQIPTGSPDETDHLNEVFACSDGPLSNDFWKGFWPSARASMESVVIVDTCHAETLVAYITAAPQPKVSSASTTHGPPRLFFSASLEADKAFETQVNQVMQGAFTAELESAWQDPSNRVSYLSWFLAAATHLIQSVGQIPSLKAVGKNPDQLESKPFIPDS